MRIRAKVIWTGSFWRVNLPRYTEIPGTYKPVTPALITATGILAGTDPDVVLAVGPTVEVEVPDDEFTEEGRPDKDAIRARYKDNPDWDRDDVGDDV